MPSPPPPKSAAAPPALPIVTCTLSIAGTSFSACSTLSACASCASRLVPGARLCTSPTEFCSSDPRKLVFMRGLAATVPLNTTTAMSSVIAGRRSVHSMTGR